MNTLPYDYSRCDGTRAFEGCKTCLRKLSHGNPSGWQVYFTRATFDGTTCEQRIPTQDSQESKED